jgi:hypothetical protein
MTTHRHRLTWIAALGLIGLALGSVGASRDAARTASGTMVVRDAASDAVAAVSLHEGVAVPGRPARSLTARRVPPPAPAWALAARAITLAPTVTAARVAASATSRPPLTASPHAPIRAPPAA